MLPAHLNKEKLILEGCAKCQWKRESKECAAAQRIALDLKEEIDCMTDDPEISIVWFGNPCPDFVVLVMELLTVKQRTELLCSRL